MKKIKIIVLSIAIVIILVVTGVVVSYSMKRYAPDSANDNTEYLQQFMNEQVVDKLTEDGTFGEDLTEKRIKANLDLSNYYYTAEPVYSTEYKDLETDEKVFKFAIYRALVKNQNSETKEVEWNVKYEMYVYSINYEYLTEKFSAMYDDKEIVSKGNTPKFIVNFYPEKAKDAGKYLLESTDSELSQDATTTLALYDYSSNPTKKDGEYYRVQSNFFRENTMNSSHAKYFKDNKGYLTLSVKLEVNDSDDDGSGNKEITFIENQEITDFVLDGTTIDTNTMAQGSYDADVATRYYNLGYKSWIIKKYVWWQGLIAFVASGLIMTGFYFAFTYEEPVQKGKKKNKK